MSSKRITSLLAAALLALTFAVAPRADATQTLFGATRPPTLTDPDRVSVELGVKFSPTVNGTISGIRFYKSRSNTGRHIGTLWSSQGKQLARVTFSKESASGWQQARLAHPVAVRKGVTYVASYLAPSGRYSSATQGFSKPYRSKSLTVPVGGGVYAYGRGGFPSKTWNNSNYYVDVMFTPAAPQPTPEPTPKPSPGPTVPTDQPNVHIGQLPRIPWEGAAYWGRFAKANAAGWDDPDFFPVAVWWSVASSAEEVAFDKSLGINTYVLTNPQADYRLIEDGGLFYVGGPMAGATAASPHWVGTFLDDEVDGRFEPGEGFAILQQESANNSPATTGRFRYANYTSSLVTYDRAASIRNQYVNAYTDAVSLDQYFYSVPQCDWGASSLRWATPIGQTPITPTNCRTSSSYGKMVDLMREADATDGRLQSIWNFVEVVGDHQRLDGDKVQGAAMSSVIHGARGIAWFPQSFEGGCTTGNAFRTYQYSQTDCLKAQVEGAQKVNKLIASLAPVLNTQSVRWNFGPGIDSMLKVRDGSAYVFAMTRDGGTGLRTFTLPHGVNGDQVEVIGENRSISVVGRTFSDTFAKESSYHIYRIALQ